MNDTFRVRVVLAAIFVLLTNQSLPGADPLHPIPVGSDKQLLLDRTFFASAKGIKLTMNPPVKAGPAIAPEKPWERGWVLASATFLEDGAGVYKAWYTASPLGAKLGEELSYLCYAESRDGVTWRKPELGVFDWRGSQANNITLAVTLESSSVFIDPIAPPAQRYKLLALMNDAAKPPHGPGMYIYTSPDGIRWSLNPTNVFPFVPDTTNQAIYDARIRKYVAYVRVWNPERKVGRIEMEDILKPWPYDKTAKSDPRWAGGPPPPGAHVPVAFGYDADDPPSTDIYNPGFAPYPWAANAYFLFPAPYRLFPPPPKGPGGNDGLLDIQMAVSRDGITFARVSREPYIPLGVKGSPDAGSMYMVGGMLRHGDEIYQFYGGYPYSHGTDGPPGVPHGTLFRTVQRLDGFVSADADPAGGEFVTPSLSFTGSKLVLNLNASATGEVAVELRDAHTTQPIRGYTFSDSDPARGNDTAHVMTWNGKSDLKSLSAKPVQLAVRLRSAKVYAFQFTP